MELHIASPSLNLPFLQKLQVVLCHSMDGLVRNSGCAAFGVAIDHTARTPGVDAGPPGTAEPISRATTPPSAFMAQHPSLALSWCPYRPFVLEV